MRVFQTDFAPRRLSQATAFSVATDILEKIGVSEERIAELIDKAPSAALAEEYRERLKECRDKGVTTVEGASCLYKLFQDIKAGENGAAAAPPSTVSVPKQPTPFPIVPVAIGAVVLAGIGLYFALK
jgi:hypothetical protein